MPDHDVPVLDRLGDRVHEAALRAEREARDGARGTGRARRWSPRVLAVAALVVLPTAGASAAATVLALRGAVIPAPEATPREQAPAPGTERVTGVVAADPAPGRPAWTLRLATSRTGLLCSTVGQQVGGRFGVVGLDGRFRVLAPGVADACSARREGASSLVGARVFDARARAEVRTVVSGVGGDGLRAVEVEHDGRRRRVRVHAGGVFLAALRGLPEDIGLRVRLRFAGGRREEHPFGIAPLVLRDPAGGPAWEVERSAVGGDDRTCAVLRHARHRPGSPVSPAACGRLRRSGAGQRGVFLAVRRVTPGTGGPGSAPFGDGDWRGAPARLLVWGAAGDDVASIEVRGPDGREAPGTWSRPNGAFAFVLGSDVRPGEARVVVRLRDGRRIETTRSLGLVAPPDPKEEP